MNPKKTSKNSAIDIFKTKNLPKILTWINDNLSCLTDDIKFDVAKSYTELLNGYDLSYEKKSTISQLFNLYKLLANRYKDIYQFINFRKIRSLVVECISNEIEVQLSVLLMINVFDYYIKDPSKLEKDEPKLNEFIVKFANRLYSILYIIFQLNGIIMMKH